MRNLQQPFNLSVFFHLFTNQCDHGVAIVCFFMWHFFRIYSVVDLFYKRTLGIKFFLQLAEEA